MKSVVRLILTSPEFSDPANYWARYSWPVEFVVRLIKEVGWVGYSVNSTLTPLANMGQQLFEPPDVAGWALGAEWFSTGMRLERMNFAAALPLTSASNVADVATPYNRSPETLLAYMLDRCAPPRSTTASTRTPRLCRAGGAWTGSATQVLAKAAGLAHLIGASSEYQFC